MSSAALWLIHLLKTANSLTSSTIMTNISHLLLPILVTEDLRLGLFQLESTCMHSSEVCCTRKETINDLMSLLKSYYRRSLTQTWYVNLKPENGRDIGT